MVHLYEDHIKSEFKVVSRSGDEYVCQCPYHDGSGNPHLYVNGNTGLYFCHVCHAKGSIGSADPTPGTLQFRIREMQTKGMAAKRLPRQPQTLPDGFLAQFGYQHPYWTDRGLSEATVRQFELGFDITKNHAIIPFRDHIGDLKGIIRRSLVEGDIKYRNPKGITMHHYLFGSHLLEGRRKVALVEGPVDAIACWNARVPALAILGSYISAHQIELLRRLGIYTVIMMYDNDEAGRAANFDTWNRLAGFNVHKGEYRQYWGHTDPGALKPQQLRKMYHSATLYEPSH